MTNKLTNVVAMEMAIEAVKENEGSVELIEKLEKIKEGFEKKKSSTKKTATQEENEKLKEIIVNFLTESEKRFTATELAKEVPELEELTNQRITSLLTALVKDFKVKREVEKRKAYFFVDYVTGGMVVRGGSIPSPPSFKPKGFD